MSDLPPDLPRLRTLETWLRYTLARVEQQIAHLEQQQHINRTITPPEPPPWLAEYDISGQRRVVQIHRGDCAMTGPRTKKISEREARAGILEARACQFCRPDTALGILD